MEKTKAIWNEDFERRRRRIRLTVAVNLFKRFLLGDLHIGGRSQVTAVFGALADLDCADLRTPNTWKSWFDGGGSVPKLTKVRVLDTVAQRSFERRRPSDGSQQQLAPRFFEELVFGGLLNAMTAMTESKSLESEVQARASRYEPLSEWHLHVDALEVSAQSDGFGDLPWNVIKSIGATRILHALHRLWGPRGGVLFESLSSALRLQWEAATPDRRKTLREFYERLAPDPFEQLLNCGATPNWSRAGVRADAAPNHIYKTLFAVGADTDFLVADRMAAWTLDLATSGLAMQALAWSDGYRTFGLHGEDEMIFWRAFDALLFGAKEGEDFADCISVASRRCDALWSDNALSVFEAAQQSYWAEVADLGLKLNELREFALMAWNKKPLRYRSDFRRPAPWPALEAAKKESDPLWRRLGQASRKSAG